MKVYVGMEVHRKRSQVAVVDDAGTQQRNRNVATPRPPPRPECRRCPSAVHDGVPDTRSGELLRTS
jgi:hypothetical protein